MADCFRLGLSVEEVQSLCQIDRWFLHQISELVAAQESITSDVLNDPAKLRRLKSQGFSDKMICYELERKERLEISESELYNLRKEMGIVAVCMKRWILVRRSFLRRRLISTQLSP